MLSIEEFKKKLGRKADSFSESEIECLRVAEDQFADVFFDVWLRKRNQKNQFPFNENGGKI